MHKQHKARLLQSSGLMKTVALLYICSHPAVIAASMMLLQSTHSSNRSLQIVASQQDSALVPPEQMDIA